MPVDNWEAQQAWARQSGDGITIRELTERAETAESDLAEALGLLRRALKFGTDNDSASYNAQTETIRAIDDLLARHDAGGLA